MDKDSIEREFEAKLAQLHANSGEEQQKKAYEEARAQLRELYTKFCRAKVSREESGVPTSEQLHQLKLKVYSAKATLDGARAAFEDSTVDALKALSKEIQAKVAQAKKEKK